MKKKILIMAVISALLTSLVPVVSAEVTKMYVGNQYIDREFDCINGFDMLPVLDIAGELGGWAYFENDVITLSLGNNTFTLKMGDPSVYDQNGWWYGLDIVPQWINNHVMIPAKFLSDNAGVTISWDDQTKCLFVNSDYTYKWLINTAEYQAEKKRLQEEAAEAKRQQEQKAKAKEEYAANIEAAKKFRVGTQVLKSIFVLSCRGTVQKISDGNVLVVWNGFYNSNGVKETNPFNISIYEGKMGLPLNEPTWYPASSLYISQY